MLPRDCLKRNDDTVPEECRQLKYTFFECKRSIVSATISILELNALLRQVKIDFE